MSNEAIDLRTKLLGHDLPLPMITCPMGGQGMIHVNAEVANAGGTGAAGTLYVSSGASTKTLEEIAQGDARTEVVPDLHEPRHGD